MLARERALELALAEARAGVHEIGTSNRGPRVDQYQQADDLPGEGYPWCMAFIQWCYRTAGRTLPTLTASVGSFAAWARKAGWITTRPARGDIVCFNFDADNWPDHVGIVRQVLPAGLIRTVEGNTSGTAAGSQDDGGAVACKTRRASRCVFVRVPGIVPAPEPRYDVDAGTVTLRGQRWTPALAKRLHELAVRHPAVTIRRRPT